MASDGPVQVIEWLGMRMRVPADWEIIRHSVKRTKGRLVLVDRRQQRLLVSWVQIKERPDFQRVVSDYRSRDLSEDAETRFEKLSWEGRWHGYRRRRGEAALTRAGLYHNESKRWIEAMVFWPEGADDRIERTLLETFAVSDDSRGPMKVRAFGIELRAPEGWELEETEVRLAAVELSLKRRGQKATVKRLGMVEDWFKGDLEGFLGAQLGQHGELRPATWNGHAAQRGEGWEPGSILRRVLHLQRPRTALMWVCPESHSLFHVTVSGRDREGADPEEMAVRCCGSAQEPGR